MESSSPEVSRRQPGSARPCALVMAGLVPGLALGMALAQRVSRYRRGQRLQQQRLRELEQSVTALQVENEVKTQLLSILGHDLRTPFATFRNMVGLLEEHLLEPVELESALPNLRLQIDSLYGSLDNLLRWSSHQADHPFSLSPVPVVSIACEIAGMYRPAAMQKQVTIREPGPSGERALFDADALRLILRNLLDNAIKFTPRGGRVEIAVTSEPQGVVVQVSDTGLGMSDAQMAHLFELSQERARVGTGTAGERGLGLGLRLCRDYAEHGGGRLSVTSHPGRGSCFEIRLPAMQT